MKHICPICNKEYELSSSAASRMKKNPDIKTYCSKECRSISTKLRQTKTKLFSKVCCGYCNKEFEITRSQYNRKIKNPDILLFCSQSCSCRYKSQKRSEILLEQKPLLKCNYCDKEFKALPYDYAQLKRYPNHKVFCCKEHKEMFVKAYHKAAEENIKRYREYWNKEKRNSWTKQYRQLNRERILENDRSYYKNNKVRLSQTKSKSNYDFSPLQQNHLNLNKSESSKFVQERATAVPKANKSGFGERTSKRKGVCYLRNKYKWCASLKINNHLHRKLFNTEEEAIAYRIYLEDKYYTAEQLAIRDKYEKLNTKKE